ncbi:hypothetical protein BaRGS_00038876 [Batillaria attramentaria]|uniref:Uncharacterized protein n=1 Tax=Batillaria attramentaria TaxID=370345 RepID=A0ABD0J4M4_9CAEN
MVQPSPLLSKVYGAAFPSFAKGLRCSLHLKGLLSRVYGTAFSFLSKGVWCSLPLFFPRGSMVQPSPLFLKGLRCSLPLFIQGSIVQPSPLFQRVQIHDTFSPFPALFKHVLDPPGCLVQAVEGSWVQSSPLVEGPCCILPLFPFQP